MPTESQRKATKRYNDKTYERITFRVKRGGKKRIEDAAAAQQKSVNRFVTDAVNEKINSVIP